MPDAPTLDDAVVDEATPVEAAEPAEAESIGDAHSVPESTEVVMHTPAGALTLSPTQSKLTDDQRDALVAIGIDTKSDPGVVPHVRPFMHMCQIRGIDPFAREAYLIGRGKGRNRKWTMQVGIDGYRRIAGRTGKFRRVVATYWTGAEDDDSNYFLDTTTGVMRRKWYDFWPESKGNPGAAKVVVEHYDDMGQPVLTEAVANWEMFAPYTDKWQGSGESARKVIGDDGKPVRELGAMWEKGGPHMLAKCAEALCYRRAFAGDFSGIYTHEEMSRADAIERQRLAAEQTARRTEAYVAATSGPSAPELVQAPPSEDTPAKADRPDSGPVKVGETVEEVVADMAEAQGRDVPADQPPAVVEEWLRAEIAEQANILETKVSLLVRRQAKALGGKNIEDFTVEELLKAAANNREVVAGKLRATGRDAEAEAYETVQPGTAAPLDVLFGRADEVVDGEIVDDEDPDGVDPEAPHDYDDAEGACGICGRFVDEEPHITPAQG